MKIKVFNSQLTLREKFIQESEEVIREQLEEYLDGSRKSFDLNFSLHDTAQGDILREINRIPYGETRTYSEIAEKTGSAAIAVGQTCSQNPLPLVIPCHRVVGKNSIGGYQAGKEVKKELLEIEK